MPSSVWVFIGTPKTGSGVIESPTKARELWLLEAVAQHRHGGCWVLTNHPFLSGRPSRAQQLDELMAHVSGCADVWTASLEQIAIHVRSLGLPARSVTYPDHLADHLADRGHQK